MMGRFVMECLLFKDGMLSDGTFCDVTFTVGCFARESYFRLEGTFPLIF